MSVVMQLSERLEIWIECTLSIVIWKSKIIFSKRLYKVGLVSIIMHNQFLFCTFSSFAKKSLREEAETSHKAHKVVCT